MILDGKFKAFFSFKPNIKNEVVKQLGGLRLKPIFTMTHPDQKILFTSKYFYFYQGLSLILGMSNAGMGKERPAGQIRPVDAFCLA